MTLASGISDLALAIGTDMKNVNSALSALEGNVDSLQTAVTALQEAVAALQATVSGTPVLVDTLSDVESAASDGYYWVKDADS